MCPSDNPAVTNGRTALVHRKTAETDVSVRINLDGTGLHEIDTGVGFLNHMLTLFAAHSRFDLYVTCVGDTDVDDHHSVEDIGIALGQAFLQAIGQKQGITRYGQMILPMDEALILAAVDISGRGYLGYRLDIPAQRIGTFDTELTQEFFAAFARCAELTLHLRQFDGVNSHHIVEGAFKATARALKAAVAIDPALGRSVPSTKGVL